MKVFGRDESFKEFEKHWDSLKSEWFKLEVLQDYSGEDTGPSLDAWLKGDKSLSRKLMKDLVSKDWIKSCQSLSDNGVELIRLHVVDYPLTKYLEWEFEHYKVINIPLCKEKVYIINKLDVDDIKLPKGDLMIFDETTVAINSYDDMGKMQTQTFYYKDSDDISSFLDIRHKLINHAKPL